MWTVLQGNGDDSPSVRDVLTHPNNLQSRMKYKDGNLNTQRHQFLQQAPKWESLEYFISASGRDLPDIARSATLISRCD